MPCWAIVIAFFDGSPAARVLSGACDCHHRLSERWTRSTCFWRFFFYAIFPLFLFFSGMPNFCEFHIHKYLWFMHGYARSCWQLQVERTNWAIYPIWICDMRQTLAMCRMSSTPKVSHFSAVPPFSNGKLCSSSANNIIRGVFHSFQPNIYREWWFYTQWVC